MNSALLFLIVVLVIACGYTLHVFKSFPAAYRYFRYTEKGKQAWKGIAMFVGLAVAIAGIYLLVMPAKASAGENWFAYGQIYVGAENTSDLNTICDPGGVNDRIVSHGGVRVNIYRSTDRKFETNAKYTHHSCAFGGDRHVYDAGGLEASFKLWGD